MSELNIKCDRRTVYFFEEVTPKSCLALKMALKDVTRNCLDTCLDYNLSKDQVRIELYIQSNGGDCTSAFSIVDYMKKLQQIVSIDTIIDGFAASGATIISLAGTNRYITKNSHIMIHQASHFKGWSKGIDFVDYGKYAEKMYNKLFNYYITEANSKNKLLTEEKLEKMFLHDTYLFADECIKYGFADRYLE